MQYIELIVIWVLVGNLTERNKDLGLEPVAKLIYNCYSLNTRENENVIRKRWKNILRYWIEFYNGILYIFSSLPPSVKPVVIHKHVREKIG